VLLDCLGQTELQVAGFVAAERETCQVIALGWALWLEWFAARVALELGPLPAAGLVALDVALGLLSLWSGL